MKTMALRTVNLVDDGRPAYIRVACPTCGSPITLSMAEFAIDADGFVLQSVVCLKTTGQPKMIHINGMDDQPYCSFAGLVRVKGMK